MVSKPLLDDLRVHSRPEHVRGVGMSPVPVLKNIFYAGTTKPLRLVDLKRALRWLRAQYQRRAEEVACGPDRA